MVKSVTTHTCEVCGFESGDEEAVKVCEAQGVPVSELKVGDFVGIGVHAWWKRPALGWALTMPIKPGEQHSPQGRGDEWRPALAAAEADPSFRMTPMSNWFLPIWRVVGIFVAHGHSGRLTVGNHTVSVHATRTYLWTPQHANCSRGSEKIAWTSAGHTRMVQVGADAHPTLTQQEEFRFNDVVASLAKSPARRNNVPLL